MPRPLPLSVAIRRYFEKRQNRAASVVEIATAISRRPNRVQAELRRGDYEFVSWTARPPAPGQPPGAVGVWRMLVAKEVTG